MTPVGPASLPELSSPYALGAEQIADYGRDGHVLLRGIASAAEVAPYRRAIGEAVERRSTERRPLSERDTYARAFLQITNLWEGDEAVRRFVLARRFAGIAAGLMGVPRVRLYHDQALYKEPGGGHTPWHQDQYYWPLEGGNTVTMWMPLVDASAEMGTMTFASGSHREGYLGRLEISDQSEAYFARFVDERGIRLARAGAMAAGDATFHSGWTLHSAPGNSTDRAREVMTVIYFADGTHVIAPDNPHREADLAAWIPGGKIGHPAASALNPLVYDAAS
ncbi:MAG: phytanoyl-CoA dioxygenase family protein [Chthonomonadales bacterium]|nr:phytanoyl-CoA dioxygenase family protein [Chthonomonadales bacterium]